MESIYIQAIDPFAIQPQHIFGVGWQLALCVGGFLVYLALRKYLSVQKIPSSGEQIANFVFASAVVLIGFQLVKNFGIRWYGLAYLTGFVSGYLIIQGLGARGRLLISPGQIGDFVFTVALGTIIGGRLGYCLFYSPGLLTDFYLIPTHVSFPIDLTVPLPFWGVLAVHNGGMASHGGIIGIVVACYLFARTRGIPTAHLCDLTTLGGTIGVFFGRIANFINGELVGRPASEAVRWAVKFPQDIYLWPTQDPARLVSLREVVQLIGIPPSQWGDILSGLGRDAQAPYRVESALTQIVVEIQQGNSAVTAALRPLLDARHPSQLYEALLEGLLMFVIINLLWIRPKKPGVITGAFLSLYSIVRIIGEQFRMPDAQIGFQIFGLTRGQILSIFLFLFGLFVLYLSRRMDRKAVGGWRA